MVAFWANRINYNLDRLEEVPAKLKEKVKLYIEEHKAAATA